jgi:hypothetical protein
MPERRLKELIAEQKNTVGLNESDRPIKTGTRKEPVSKPTLSDAGISKKLSSRSQKLAAMPAAEPSDGRASPPTLTAGGQKRRWPTSR